MARWLRRWRAALRMARRDAWRHRGRSLLVAVMVGLPVGLSVALATAIASDSVEAGDEIPRALGRAQAAVGFVGGSTSQSASDPMAGWYGADRTRERGDRTAADVAARLDARTSVARLRQSAAVEVPDGAISATLLELDPGDPATQGMVEVAEGRAPRAADEVLVGWAFYREGLRVGDDLTVAGGATYRIVGVGSAGPYDTWWGGLGVLGTPGSLGLERARTTVLVDRSAPVTWAQVQRLNAAGYAVTSRSVIEHPPPVAQDETASSGDPEERAVVVIAVTAIVIEVVLLAGPAFAVGVRRQRRTLALVAATGGDRGDVRRVVLAQAVVLGLGSALVWSVAALVATRLTMVYALRFVDFGEKPLDIPWPLVGAAVALGVVAAVIAALVPAVQASRASVAAVLAGRSGVLRSRRGWPVVGAIVLALGLAMCLAGGDAEWVIAGGAVTAVLGAIVLTPWLVGVVGGLGSRLPLPLRLATRDAARQRGRSAPAIAAIMAAVAGVTVVAIGWASNEAAARDSYVARAAEGATTVGLPARSFEEAQQALGEQVPNARLVPMTAVAGGILGADGSRWEPADVQHYDADTTVSPITSVMVGDADRLRAWGLDLDADGAAALDAGRVLVAGGGGVADERVRLRVRNAPADGAKRAAPVTVTAPATVADLAVGRGLHATSVYVAFAAMTPRTADRLGLTVRTMPLDVVDAPRPLTERQTEALSDALTLVGDGTSFYVDTERGYQSDAGWLPWALAGLGAAAVLIGTLSATGLALSDARVDLATLSAVGATPRTRRVMAAAQTVVLGVLGAGLGVLVGLGPGIAIARPLTYGDYLDIPWLVLLGIAVVVPVIAALGAGLVVRSRLPLVRRLAG